MSSEEIPSIAIYMGEGASHSWIWFVDTLERAGQIDLRFLDEKDLKDGGLKSCHVLLLSGGDTFKIAGALDSSGSEALSDFISRGGTYIQYRRIRRNFHNCFQPSEHRFGIVLYCRQRLERFAKRL